jgi:uncharacterized repeat protein (TIGR03803 family)
MSVATRLSVCLVLGAALLFAIPAQAVTFQTLYTFTGSDDGGGPTGGLLFENGMLYGATYSGGEGGKGTIFELDPATGDLTTLYAFTGGEDGANPTTSLISRNGVLYGTTRYGGAGFGTVFALDSDSGDLTTLHTFSGGEDGAQPVATLLFKKGTLFGTAALGGVQSCEDDAGCGVAFSIDLATGGFATLFAFPDDLSDGIYPESSLLLKKGELFGTTDTGGIEDGEQQSGTLFALDPATQALSVLHVFTGLDGQAPVGGLVYKKGQLYGTTEGGGPTSNGTVFQFDVASGTLTTLHAFDGTDGRDPKDALIYRKGKLYGVTLGGGTGCAKNCGTAFELDPATGTLTTLHNFTGGADGEQPWGSLVYVKGAFYGTTVLGADGYGTVFEIKP